MTPIFGFLVLAGFLSQALAQGANWNWTDQDWANFGGNYEVCGYGRQSPIALVHGEELPHSPIEGPMFFHNFADDAPGVFTNDGHNLIFTPDNRNLVMEKGTLPDLADNFKYEMIQATLHWGQNDSVGSNHWIDGKQYAAELVLHQENRFFRLYAPPTGPLDPLDYYHGFMAVSLLIQTKPHHYNVAFEPILEAAEALAEDNEAEIHSTLNFRDLLREIGTSYPELFTFFSYRGSRMTPSPERSPCSQTYGYIVPDLPITVGKCQLNALRKLQFRNEQPMLNTYRYLQTQVPGGSTGGTGQYNYITAEEQENP